MLKIINRTFIGQGGKAEQLQAINTSFLFCWSTALQENMFPFLNYSFYGSYYKGYLKDTSFPIQYEPV